MSLRQQAGNDEIVTETGAGATTPRRVTVCPALVGERHDLHAEGPERLLAAVASGEDPGTVLRERDAVLPVRGPRSLGGAHGPVVRLHPRLRVAYGQHRLDGQADPGPELGASRAGSVVEHVRRLVHGGADTVPAVLLADANPAAAEVLEPGPDVDEGVAVRDGGDAPPHRLLGDVDQGGVG